MFKKGLFFLLIFITLSSIAIAAKIPTPPYPNYFMTKVDNINLTAPKANINAYYPLIKKQPNLPEATEFNALMANTIGDIIDDFTDEVTKIDINSKTPSTLTINYKITYFKPETIVSLQLIVDKFFAGAAHPNEYTYTINYNLAELSALTLDRLFKENKPYLKIIARYCKNELKKKNLGKYATIDQSTQPIPENYLVWNLTPKGLLITFDAYLVAPYVYGKQIINIPYSQLQPYMLSTYQEMLAIHSSSDKPS